MKKGGWFERWFDTEYYHLLYRNRDDREASDFLRNLVNHLTLPAGSRIADIACGKGRHSRVLAAMGFRVAGYDLSENSILYARQHASGQEEFYIHDIRKPYGQNGFDMAVNLFTSFGYFDSREEDILALSNIFNMLNVNGYFVQDYLNGASITSALPIHEKQRCGGVEFDIEKSWQPPCIVKRIQVHGKRGTENFIERVKIYSMQELREMHEQCGFQNISIFGDYRLGEFDESSSPRMILISQKTQL